MNTKRITIFLGLVAIFIGISNPLTGQKKKEKVYPKISKEHAKILDRERSATIEDLKQAIKYKDSREAIRQMRILMRLYYDKKTAKEVSKYLIKVIDTRFSKNEPKFVALDYLKELGEVGIKELEKALLSRFRRQPVEIRLKAITTLIRAGAPSSWKVLFRLSNDKNPHIAVAAIKGLSAWKNLPSKELKKLVKKICSKLRPPTKEEIEKDLDLPPVQIALREVLSEITGKKKETVKEWKKFVNVWVRNGCPVFNVRETLENKKTTKNQTQINDSHPAEKSYSTRIR